MVEQITVFYIVKIKIVLRRCENPLDFVALHKMLTHRQIVYFI